MSEGNVERGEWPTADIPPSWHWADFTQVFANVTDNDRKLKQKDYEASGLYPVVDQGMAHIGGYTSDSSLVHPVDPPCVVFGDHTRCVKMITFPFVQGADGVKTLKSLLNPRYGYWLLVGIRLPDRGYSRHYQFLRNSLFPIAPLPEQHRIVEKIEELFSDLDAGVASLERAKANLKRYRASVLKSAVEGRLTEEWRKEHPQTEDGQMLLDRILRERREKWEKDQVLKFKEKGKEPPKNWQSKYEEPSAPDASELPELPEGWVWATVEQFSDLENGDRSANYPSRSHFVSSGIPFINAGHLESGRVCYEDMNYITPDKFKSLLAGKVQKGDVLFCLRGSLGKVALIAEEGEGAIASSLVILRIMPQISNRLLRIYLQSPRTASLIAKYDNGTAQPNLSARDLSRFTFPLPPLAEQEQIVALVEERLSQIDSAEKTIDAELIRSKRLRQSILKRAFEGKLVPQNPKDEPASVLLERIKASRETEQPQKKAKKVKAK
jgi:type I restriction enzyme S subunit